jgi:hypothetical protein
MFWDEYMSTKEDSFKRLRAEGWTSGTAVRTGLTAGGATIQSLADGSGSCVLDEYSILVSIMPPGKSPENFLLEMANDLNGTVNDKGFNAINLFVRSQSGRPCVGEIIHIDIAGPDNGSVMLVEMTPEYFIFQTVTTPQDGSHPENGSREFGFERIGTNIKFYTRGVSRPGNIAVRLAGAMPQMIGWTRLCRGLSDTLSKSGGTPVANSFVMFKQNQDF